MLIFVGHPKVCEDKGDHEYVIHRERQLNEIAGEELDCFFLSTQRNERRRETHRQSEPQRRPPHRFTESDYSRFAMENPEIKREENENCCKKSHPMPWGDFDRCEHRVSLWIENTKVKNRRKLSTSEGCSIA